YGNNAGEPCNSGAGFAASWCQQAYRWNLDYVVDPRGNSMTYFYEKYSGRVGANNNTNNQPYDLAANLDHIDYGTRAGTEGAAHAPMRVVFGKTARCVGGCTPGEYPDTPMDLYCASTTSCPNTRSPVFFNAFKLSTVTTQVWSMVLDPIEGYRSVDRWDLVHSYPPSGDNIPPAGQDT